MSKKSDEGKIFAFLGVFLTIIGFVIVLLAKKEDKYAMFYAKQGLVLGVASIAIWIAGIILAFIPIIGWLALLAAWIIWLVLWIKAIINSLSGKEKETPIVGKYAKKFNI